MWTFLKCPWHFVKKRPTSMNPVDQGICYLLKLWFSQIQTVGPSSGATWWNPVVYGTDVSCIFQFWVSPGFFFCNWWKKNSPFSKGSYPSISHSQFRVNQLWAALLSLLHQLQRDAQTQMPHFWLGEEVWVVFCLWISRKDLWSRVSALDFIRKVPGDTRMLSLSHHKLSCQQVKTTCSLLVILTAEAT